MNRLTRSRILLFLQCLLIFGLSSIKDFSPIEEIIPWTEMISDIAAHFFLFFILCLLAISDFKEEKSKILSTRPLIAAVAFTTLYGISDELHQLYVPGRHFEIKDMIVDFASAVTAVLAYQIIFRKRCG